MQTEHSAEERASAKKHLIHCCVENTSTELTNTSGVVCNLNVMKFVTGDDGWQVLYGKCNTSTTHSNGTKRRRQVQLVCHEQVHIPVISYPTPLEELKSRSCSCSQPSTNQYLACEGTTAGRSVTGITPIAPKRSAS